MRVSPYELNLAIAALANTIACNLSDDELNIVVAALSQLGDSLTTIAIMRQKGAGNSDSLLDLERDRD